QIFQGTESDNRLLGCTGDNSHPIVIHAQTTLIGRSQPYIPTDIFTSNGMSLELTLAKDSRAFRSDTELLKNEFDRAGAGSSAWAVYWDHVKGLGGRRKRHMPPTKMSQASPT